MATCGLCGGLQEGVVGEGGHLLVGMHSLGWGHVWFLFYSVFIP